MKKMADSVAHQAENHTELSCGLRQPTCRKPRGKSVKTIFRLVFCMFFLTFPALITSCKTLPIDSYSFDTVAQTQDANGLLPEKVYIRTMTQSYCQYYDFVLIDGRIYCKKTGGGQWELFKKTGLPYSSFANFAGRFKTPEKISSICADGDSLYAMDSEGYLYYCYLNKFATAPYMEWMKRQGFPANRQFRVTKQIENFRSWSVGARRSEVMWQEDIYGNPHHYGTMGIETYYFLSEDGREIRFCDSGLPQDTSRIIMGPEDGSFICESLSASASTLFVIGNQGTMYTRLIDFDTMGCDPIFFQYTYDRLEQNLSGSDYFSNYSPWALPAEYWKEQPKIELKGKARLTSLISIAQNGQGNAARELRVAGTNEKGEKGYYSKMIMDDSWTFHKAPIRLSEKVFLDPSKSEIADTDPRFFSLDGQLYKNGIELKDISCTISGIDLSSTDDCMLILRRGEEEFKCKLYMVEKWTYVIRDDPGRDGSSRIYYVTPEFESGDMESLGEEFKKLISDMFEGKNHRLFTFSSEATDTYFHMTVPGKDSQNIFAPIPENEYSIFVSASPQGSIDADTFKHFHSFMQPSLQKCVSEDLVLDCGRIYTVNDRSEIEKKIRANKNYLKELKQVRTNYIDMRNSTQISRWGYSAVELFTKITFLNQLNFPKIKQMTSVGGDLLESTVQSFADMADHMSWSYENVCDLVSLRIEKYSELIESFDKGEFMRQLPGNLMNSYPEYYSLVGMPKFAMGKKSSEGRENYAGMVDIIPYFPGYFIVHENGDSTLVMLKNTASAISKFLKRHDGENLEEALKNDPLELKAEFMMFSSHDRRNSLLIDMHDKRYEYKDGRLIWDGSMLSVKIQTALFSEHEIFKGVEIRN